MAQNGQKQPKMAKYDQKRLFGPISSFIVIFGHFESFWAISKKKLIFSQKRPKMAQNSQKWPKTAQTALKSHIFQLLSPSNRL